MPTPEVVPIAAYRRAVGVARELAEKVKAALKLAEERRALAYHYAAEAAVHRVEHAMRIIDREAVTTAAKAARDAKERKAKADPKLLRRLLDRAERAQRMKRDGHTDSAIARRLGISRSRDAIPRLLAVDVPALKSDLARLAALEPDEPE